MLKTLRERSQKRKRLLAQTVRITLLRICSDIICFDLHNLFQIIASL